ncbi:MAG: hypothetical protein WCS73_09685, partial [Lentisphaeria bacterium]
GTLRQSSVNASNGTESSLSTSKTGFERDRLSAQNFPVSTLEYTAHPMMDLAFCVKVLREGAVCWQVRCLQYRSGQPD